MLQKKIKGHHCLAPNKITGQNRIIAGFLNSFFVICIACCVVQHVLQVQDQQFQMFVPNKLLGIYDSAYALTQQCAFERFVKAAKTSGKKTKKKNIKINA